VTYNETMPINTHAASKAIHNLPIKGLSGEIRNSGMVLPSTRALLECECIHLAIARDLLFSGVKRRSTGWLNSVWFASPSERVSERYTYSNWCLASAAPQTPSHSI